jgi:outer membrane protein
MMIMKIGTYFLVVICSFVLITASFGDAVMMTPPDEGEQGSASSVTSPQGQGTPPASGEQNVSTPAMNQEEASATATNPQGQGSAPAEGEQNVFTPADQQATSQAGAPPAASEQSISTPTTNQEEASPVATGSQASPPAAGGQAVSPPAANQEEAAPAAPSAQGSAPTGEQDASTPAMNQEEAPATATSPQGPSSPPAAAEQNVSTPAMSQGEASAATPVLHGSPPTGEQNAATPAMNQQEASPPVVGSEMEAPAAAGSPGAYSAVGASEGTSSPVGEGGVAPLTLKESIGIALQKSPTVQSAQSAIKEAQYRRLSTISDFLPQVNMQYSYIRLDKASSFYYPPPINTTVTAGTKDNYNWATSVSQPVFTGGALINSYLLAKIGVDSAKVQFEQTKLDLVLQVRAAYYAVLTAEKGVEVAQQAVQQLESHFTVAKAFFEVGITAKNDLLQVEVQLAQTRQNLITAEHNLEVARAVFNTLLRRDINESVRLAEALEYTPMTIDMNSLMEEALRERPEIRLSDLGIQSAKKEVGIAASKLFPQLSIVYTYERLGDEPRVEGSPYTRMHDWNVMGVAQWTVWDWGKAWWGVGESKARVFQAQCVLEQVKDSVKLDVQAAALKVTEAKKNIQVAETAVSQAEEDARINEERFKGQVATTTDVLDSLTRLTQARTNYYSALSDYDVAKARLLRAIGGM